MVIQDFSALDRFEAERPRLRALAYRMLGSAAEADDAVQEAWLRFDRADLSQVNDLAAWLTTVVGRVCLNLLRARQTRREESLETFTSDWLGAADQDRVPHEEAELADSVGLAMLVVLDRLSPAERVAFVLHDMFQVAFDDIARMMERSPAAVRQLAGRARAKVRGTAAQSVDPVRRRHAVEAYLAATRTGDFEALLTLLDPEVELRADAAVTGATRPLTLQGALAVARSALAADLRARFTAPALVDGDPALIMAPLGRLSLVIRFAFTGSAISGIDIVADPDRLRAVDIALA
ncbi:sigma-70 family RNA polymerase sigma factor [Actinoallomurus spadix]|uniref:Sigma-70 family RNA polymerase sigma factor n=1 Tax=Actinoallomurus spadix TaxID=79912 RepID=A0ABN0X797_9ACTN|nr:sigma-70 family RNA polymerase sigma factor [Actinoallomurus spadix]MCO5987037.1 sigma-70 family RNA polymerase sigma factor [Actinoallomurus spadix]